MAPLTILHMEGEVTRPAVVDTIEVHAVAELLNPDPVMDSVVPVGPSRGVIVTEGTENDANPFSEPGLPVTVIWYDPGVGLDVTTKAAELIVPPDMEHVDEVISDPGPVDEIEQLVALPKPSPVIETVVPAPPALGVRVID